MTIEERIDPELRWIVTMHLESYKNSEISIEETLRFINKEYTRLYDERLQVALNISKPKEMRLKESL